MNARRFGFHPNLAIDAFGSLIKRNESVRYAISKWMERESDVQRFPFQISCPVEETASVHRGLGRFHDPSGPACGRRVDVLIPTNHLRGDGICLTLRGKINRLAG